ncbi:hypothetical protein ANCDUO_02722 [Ancylostoma duodenale]|uniref:Uncharacterized protein n=1 Tax=Ancylostoma duodenale TaxID=51022 RepID=A0A0C2HBS7_9BILA|nr:hypothetical protein ANCDUO_02722 [Ancylostoma duodenale]
MEFFRCMAVHGVPFRYLLGSRASKYLAREEYNEKYPPSMNIKQFFCDLSKLEYGLRSNIWSFHTVQMGTSAPQILFSFSAKNTILMQLCEALISAMLCGNLSNLSTILALEHQIHRYNKGYDHTFHSLGTPTHGTLFLETACRIWAKNGRCEDKIAEAVSRIVQKCPQLLGRVTEFLKEIDYDHEVEVITEEV